MKSMKKTVTALLLLLLVLFSASAWAKPAEIKLDGLTLKVPEDYAVFESRREDGNVLTLQKDDVVFSLTTAKLNPPEIGVSLIYSTLAETFFAAMDPDYVLTSGETLFLGRTEVGLFTARVRLSGAEATVMLLCCYDEGEVTLFSVTPLDGSAPEMARLEELLAMIEKPKLYRKGLTEEPVK